VRLAVVVTVVVVVVAVVVAANAKENLTRSWVASDHLLPSHILLNVILHIFPGLPSGRFPEHFSE
jgi:hypothetical protein